MIRVVNQNRIYIIEDCFGFFKGHAMLLLIDCILVFIPLKQNSIHNYIIITSQGIVNASYEKSARFSFLRF